VDPTLSLLLVLAMIATLVTLLFSGYPVAFVLGGVGVLFAGVGELAIALGGDVDADLSLLGLVVDRFADHLVVQVGTPGMAALEAAWLPALVAAVVEEARRLAGP